ncbi:hypothetical protein VM1G_10089 [Cytospora mali]|uniref:Nudix hydrolase domain-containing protein n=1 Tax=Cytospora mali TaxID=578113 RepID=A0A194WE22_CYTMA|nr:hypothetical protein VM1G_10089 [Valsa mali]
MNESFKANRLLDLINGVDNVPLTFDYNSLYRLRLPDDTRTHGFLTPDTVSKLPWTSSFTINHEDKIVQLTPTSSETEHANAAFQAIIDGAIELGTSVFPNLTSHSEMVRIVGARTNPGGSSETIRLERFAAPLFGICSRGAHLTAYVHDTNQPGGFRIWVARRGADLHTYPGMLDTTVAGGVKAEDTPLGCILAESDEEASLPYDYVQRRIVPAGVVTYVTQSKKTGQVLPSILYVYDLELEKGVEPQPKDGEVEGFYLMTVEEVTKAMMSGEFKPNCCLVMLDFFVRHGLITEENERDYLEIVTRLRRRLPVPITPQSI